MSKNTLEKATLLVAVAVIGTASWFWWRQIQSALELLRMAYG